MKKLTWRERAVIRILFLVVKIIGVGALTEEVLQELKNIDTHISVGLGEE